MVYFQRVRLASGGVAVPRRVRVLITATAASVTVRVAALQASSDPRATQVISHIVLYYRLLSPASGKGDIGSGFVRPSVRNLETGFLRKYFLG